MTTEDLPALPAEFWRLVNLWADADPSPMGRQDIGWALEQCVQAIQRTAYEAGKRSDVVRQMAESLQKCRFSLMAAADTTEIMTPGAVMMVKSLRERAELADAALRAYREQAK